MSESVPEAFRYANLMTNLAIRSTKVRGVKVPLRNGKEVRIRGTIHEVLPWVFKGGKSSFFRDIQEEIKGTGYETTEIFHYLTNPALRGSVTSNGWVREPVSWEARNKTLLIDELSLSGAENCADTLNELLDSGEGTYLQEYNFAQGYTTRLGSLTAKKKQPIDRTDGDLSLTVNGGSVQIKTRFSCIIATYYTHLEKWTSEALGALKSRARMVPLELTLDDIDQVVKNGAPTFKWDKKMHVRKNSQVFQLRQSTYEKAYDWLKDFRQVEKNNLLPDLRELGDVLRATAVTRQNDVALWEAVLSGDIGKLDLKEKERQKKIGN